jgi:hypothetical protein
VLYLIVNAPEQSGLCYSSRVVVVGTAILHLRKGEVMAKKMVKKAKKKIVKK